ncbi:MAG: beta-lactamase family protein [Chloroflexi bacterium]|nr:beta-lactamase family protein [Chloroflexota bacterium]
MPRSLGILLGIASAILLGVSARAQSVSTLADDVERYFDRLAENGFNGSVVVAQFGDVLLREGYGLADQEAGTLNTSETVFLSGSISKQFTAAAIMTLQEDGLLDVQDSISDHLEGLPEDKRAITIHHLLTHTAGFSQSHFQDDLSPMTYEQAVEAIYALPLARQPGQLYEYSNSGYTLLAIIVQEVSGQDFQAYMMEKVFEPAGMTSTGFWDDEARYADRDLATGYVNGRVAGVPTSFPGPYWGIMGNGGVLSTPMDHFRYIEALRSETILSADAVDLMMTPHVSEGGNSFYGYGWSVIETDLGTRVTHNGGGLGGNADLAYYPNQGLVIAVISNEIIYRPPFEIQLPATEASEQLAENIASGDFERLPGSTLPIWISIVVLAVMTIIVSFLVTLLRGMLRKRRQAAAASAAQ